jgi:hypothetical protein
MIPILISIFVSTLLGIFIKDPISKWMMIFIFGTLSLIWSNQLLFNLRPFETITANIKIPYGRIYKTANTLCITKLNVLKDTLEKQCFNLKNVNFVRNTKSHNGDILIIIPYEIKTLPKHIQLWFTFPNLWIPKKNKALYKSYLGKIKVYSTNIKNV